MMEYDLQEKEHPIGKVEEIYSDSFRAGKRTYFFDVKATKYSEYYITITESKRKLQKNGKSLYEKHQIYLFKEDFEKFTHALNCALSHIKQNQPEISTLRPSTHKEEYNDGINELLVPVLDFEDLDK